MALPFSPTGMVEVHLIAWLAATEVKRQTELFSRGPLLQ
jgi:hypothetical protein